jgi:hypothetical protein
LHLYNKLKTVLSFYVQIFSSTSTIRIINMLANNLPALAATLFALVGLTNASPLKRASGQTIRPSSNTNLCLQGYGSQGGYGSGLLTECKTSISPYYGPFISWGVYPGESSGISLDQVPPKAPGLCLAASGDIYDGAVRDAKGVTCSANNQK